MRVCPYFRRRCGFSLVEVVVALAVLSLAIVGSIKLIHPGTAIYKMNRLWTGGALAAQAGLDEARARGYEWGVEAAKSGDILRVDSRGRPLSVMIDGEEFYYEVSASLPEDGGVPSDLVRLTVRVKIEPEEAPSGEKRVLGDVEPLTISTWIAKR